MTPMIGLLLQTESEMAGAGSLFAMGGVAMVLLLGIVIVFIAALWRVFSKAGEPGWAALIPLYNTYILLKIGGKPGWWLLLFLVPLVNIVMFFLLSIAVAKAFGRSAAFGVVLLCLLGGIGYLILGFGSSQYQRQPASLVAA